MGCVSSKLTRKSLKTRKSPSQNGAVSNHVVSLTSSTYGVLELDSETQQPPQCINKCVIGVKKSPAPPPWDEPAEVIDAWELMEDLDETEFPCFVQSKKSPKSRVFVEARRTQLKFSDQIGSPKKSKRFGGKENNSGKQSISNWKTESSPKTILRISKKRSLNVVKCDNSGPLFDPELIAHFEKELSEEEEQRKKPISRKSRNSSKETEEILEQFDIICPPGGENAVVVYTTTLRGIRKTFEDCNTARSILESHQIRMFERDISMHSGYKEELRGLMGKTEVRVPLVFVKGRMIGGADEIVKLEEEGKLGILLAGIPRAFAGCDGCGGVRFVLCLKCSGSRKVFGLDGKNSVKCGECNENGLIQCPICNC